MAAFVNPMTAAIAHAARGWYVTPFKVVARPDGKKSSNAYVRWSEPRGRSNDAQQVRDWWVQYPDAIIGILTKESNLLVIDLDLHDENANGLEAWLDLVGKHAEGEVPDTYTVNTPTGGMHLYFRNTDERIKNSACKLAPGVDVRGAGDKNGGIVFGAGSVRFDGIYEVANDAPVAELPAWLATLLRPEEEEQEPNLLDAYDTQGRDGQWTLAQARAEYDRIDEVVLASKGNGFNERIRDAAFRYGRFVAGGFLSQNDAYARLDAVSVKLWGGKLAEGNAVTARRSLEDGADAKKATPFVLKREKKARLPEFTDASMSEYIASEVLQDRYVHCESLGPWLAWNGKYWERTDAGAAIEAVRQYAKKKYLSVVKTEGIGSDNAKGWARYNSARAISSLVSLAGNMENIKRKPEDFDTHEDVINTPEGVLNLRTFSVTSHDPTLFLTKMTLANYRPGESSEHLEALLEAVPEDSRRWLQVHMGQGVSGRSKGRTPAVLLTGVGNNGKSLLMQTTLKALGGIHGTGYAAQVPNELLLSGKAPGGPSPEKMMLRGARFAYVEETPEGRYLDVERMKQVVGTGILSARHLHKDLVTFELTHILFINTNYPPRVAETDTATWRRLVALRFPWRYRLDNDGLGERLEIDRDGDVELERNLLEPKGLNALFTWMVDGLRLGSAHEVEMPTSVEKSIREWRKEADALLRFFDDEIVFEEGCWLPTKTLFSALQQWAKAENIANIGNHNTIASRVAEHTALAGRVEKRFVRMDRPGFERPRAETLLDAFEDDRQPKWHLHVPSGANTHAFVGIRFRRKSE